LVRVQPLKKLKLTGFNNLTKSLSFNLYDVCYAKSLAEKQAYLSYIDEQYNADRLTEILTEVTRIIGASILNVARQDYDPQGASVTILISEEDLKRPEQKDADVHRAPVETPEVGGDGSSLANGSTSSVSTAHVVAHLDTSHICVHTYPEHHPDDGICTFRADIEVATCGRVTPLHALNFLIRELDADVATIDYRVRGFTRDVSGRKVYIDHRIQSIQRFIDKDILNDYQLVDVNVYQENLFHTKLMRKKVDLDRYLFGGTPAKKAMPRAERRQVKKRLRKEIQEIFYSRNFA